MRFKKLLTLLLLALFGVWGLSTTAQNPFITVLQPNHSHIQWALKTRHLISWNDNFTKPVNIDLVNYEVAGHPAYRIASNVSGSTYSWYINTYNNGNGAVAIPTGSHYRIRVSSVVDPTYKDESDNYFRIAKTAAHTWVHVLQPNASHIQWALKTRHLVSWNDNISGRVNIDLVNYEVAGHPAYRIANNVSGSTYSWYINTYNNGNGAVAIPTGSHYRIRVSSTEDPNLKDESDNYFKIILAPIIDVYPNPSTTSVTVQFNENSNEHYVMTLYNRYNMRVLSKPVNTSATKQVRINTFNLPNGVYFLRLVSGKEIISRKIVVQH